MLVDNYCKVKYNYFTSQNKLYTATVYQVNKIVTIHIYSSAESVPYLADETCILEGFNLENAVGTATGNRNTTGQVYLNEGNKIHVQSAHPDMLLSNSWYGLIVTLVKDIQFI